MKKIAVIICLVMIAGLVVSCGGNKQTEQNYGGDNRPVTESSRETNQTENAKSEDTKTITDQQKRELEEAPDQPLLWVTYEKFLDIQKVIDPSSALSDNPEISSLWRTIEAERVNWAQNPHPTLQKSSIDQIHNDYIVGRDGIIPQFAINALLFQGADFLVLEKLHALKNDKQAFKAKFEELLK